MEPGCQVLLQTRDGWGEVRKQSEKAIHLANISWSGKPQAGDVFISSFLLSAGGQSSEQRHFSLTVRQRGRVLLSRPSHTITITKATEKQAQATVPTWSHNWLLLRDHQSQPWATQQKLEHVHCKNYRRASF